MLLDKSLMLNVKGVNMADVFMVQTCSRSFFSFQTVQVGLVDSKSYHVLYVAYGSSYSYVSSEVKIKAFLQFESN